MIFKGIILGCKYFASAEVKPLAFDPQLGARVGRRAVRCKMNDARYFPFRPNFE